MTIFKTGDGTEDTVLFVTLPLVTPDWFRIAFMGALREMTVEGNWFVEGTADENFARDKAVEMINGILFSESAPPMREIGEISMYSSSTLPDKWLPCDGAEVSRTTYAELFAVIGTTYGDGNGTTTFNVPNLIDRFPKMYDPIVAPGSENAIGGTGGAASVTLTTAQMPAHQHAQRVQPTSGASTNRLLAQSASGATQDSAIPTGSTGGGEAHENRPPFLSLGFMIYAGV